MSPVPQHKSSARFPLFNFGQFNDAAFPEPVQAEALQVVQQVVAPRDGGEEVVDLGGALFAGGVKGVAHAGSLAQWRAEKSKRIKLFCIAGGICYSVAHLLEI